MMKRCTFEIADHDRNRGSLYDRCDRLYHNGRNNRRYVSPIGYEPEKELEVCTCIQRSTMVASSARYCWNITTGPQSSIEIYGYASSGACSLQDALAYCDWRR